jgi:hypothetical protein
MTAAATLLAVRDAPGREQQQAAIDAWLRAHAPAGIRAIVAEGAFFDLDVPPDVVLERLAAGCVCCIGLLPLQVTLTRLVRTFRPASLLLLIADGAHLDRVRTLVTSGKLGVFAEEAG